MRSSMSSILTHRHQAFIGFIVSARKAADITQVELASRRGKPLSFVSKVERGERRLDVIEFCEVAETLGQDPAKLLQDSPTSTGDEWPWQLCANSGLWARCAKQTVRPAKCQGGQPDRWCALH